LLGSGAAVTKEIVLSTTSIIARSEADFNRGEYAGDIDKATERSSRPQEYRYQVKDAIREMKVTSTQKVILLIWAEWLMGANRTAWPSAQALARQTCLTVGTIHEEMQALCTQGILTHCGYRYCVKQNGTLVWRRIDHVMRKPPTSAEYAINIAAAPMLPAMEDWQVETDHGKKSITSPRQGKQKSLAVRGTGETGVTDDREGVADDKGGVADVRKGVANNNVRVADPTGGQSMIIPVSDPLSKNPERIPVAPLPVPGLAGDSEPEASLVRTHPAPSFEAHAGEDAPPPPLPPYPPPPLPRRRASRSLFRPLP
jgi:hypothetical protein